MIVITSYTQVLSHQSLDFAFGFKKPWISNGKQLNEATMKKALLVTAFMENGVTCGDTAYRSALGLHHLNEDFEWMC